MNRVTCCASCGHGLIPMLSAKGRAELSCLWCELIDARAVDMAKWADSPSGKPSGPSIRRSNEGLQTPSRWRLLIGAAALRSQDLPTI